MSASASTDCYLCGARNDLESDYCVRCDGQLLKLPTEPTDLASTDLTEFIDDDIPDIEEDLVQKTKKRRARSGSVEDQRLSDALGLTADDDDVDPDDFIDTVVTSIPRATQSANIPLIGTRTGIVPQGSMHAKEFGIRTYILLALLLLATAWLGWVTLRADGSSLTPDNLAFTNSTLPSVSTTTTEPVRRQWSEAETVGHYGPAFTRVQLFVCPAETPEGGLSKIQPVDDMWTSGIAVDEHNVLLNALDLRGANVAIVRARNGAQRLGVVIPGRSGTRIATTLSPISRTLDLGTSADGSPTFYLTYDHETNVVESHASPAGAAQELTVSDVGDLLEVRIGASRFDTDSLRQINSRVEPVEDEDAPKPETICDRANQLEFLTTEPTDQPGTN